MKLSTTELAKQCQLERGHIGRETRKMVKRKSGELYRVGDLLAVRPLRPIGACRKRKRAATLQLQAQFVMSKKETYLFSHAKKRAISLKPPLDVASRAGMLLHKKQRRLQLRRRQKMVGRQRRRRRRRRRRWRRKRRLWCMPQLLMIDFIK